MVEFPVMFAPYNHHKIPVRPPCRLAPSPGTEQDDILDLVAELRREALFGGLQDFIAFFHQKQLDFFAKILKKVLP
jgi:hypothetical protein